MVATYQKPLFTSTPGIYHDEVIRPGLGGTAKLAHILAITHRASTLIEGRTAQGYPKSHYLRNTAEVVDYSYGTLQKMMDGKYNVDDLTIGKAKSLASYLGIGAIQLLWGLLNPQTTVMDLMKTTEFIAQLESPAYSQDA